MFFSFYWHKAYMLHFKINVLTCCSFVFGFFGVKYLDLSRFCLSHLFENHIQVQRCLPETTATASYQEVPRCLKAS